MASKKITEILGDKAEELLNYKCKVDKSTLTLPSPTYMDDIFVQSDRNNRAVGALQLRATRLRALHGPAMVLELCAPDVSDQLPRGIRRGTHAERFRIDLLIPHGT